VVSGENSSSFYELKVEFIDLFELLDFEICKPNEPLKIPACSVVTSWDFDRSWMFLKLDFTPSRFPEFLFEVDYRDPPNLISSCYVICWFCGSAVTSSYSFGGTYFQLFFLVV